ncbi:probable serine/threonine-protein kinase kinX [Salvelinus fontinalis]|uniref:probable serine/threonine-protein kinase kinX n=1 Tax=Salvelinus fontinalis TaxID=8038 RepID=UPI0024861292|nr:probable serine/threonine-protein kinase kinX [Salvelinus fontinalis]
MTKRKSKTAANFKPEREDNSFLIESHPVSESRGRVNQVALPCMLFLMVAIGGASAGWFCLQQQQSIDQLSETFRDMQIRITKFQQQMGMRDAQMSSGGLIEERILALEAAQKQAQQKAEVTLTASEQLKSIDLKSQLWALHNEMNTRLAEFQQVAISSAALQAMMKNKSDDFDSVKESVAAVSSSNSALAVGLARMTSTVDNVKSRLDGQVSTVDSLTSQLEGQVTEQRELREFLSLHRVVLHNNHQEVGEIKELLEERQAKNAQALEQQLQLVTRTLDEQHISSQSLHSHLKKQLEAVHSQLVNGGPLSQEEVDSEAAEASEMAEREHEVTEEEPAEEEVEEDVTEEAVEQEAEEEDITEEAVEQEAEEEDVAEEAVKQEAEEEDVTEEAVEQEGEEENVTEEAVEQEAEEEDVTEEAVKQEAEEEDVTEEAVEQEAEEEDVTEEAVEQEAEEEDVTEKAVKQEAEEENFTEEAVEQEAEEEEMEQEVSVEKEVTEEPEEQLFVVESLEDGVTEVQLEEEEPKDEEEEIDDDNDFPEDWSPEELW